MRARAEPGAGFFSLGLVDVLEPKEALGKGAHSADPEITRAAPDFGLGKFFLEAISSNFPIRGQRELFFLLMLFYLLDLVNQLERESRFVLMTFEFQMKSVFW